MLVAPGFRIMSGGASKWVKGVKGIFSRGDLESKGEAGTPRNTTVEIPQYFADHLTERAIELFNTKRHLTTLKIKQRNKNSMSFPWEI